MTRKRCAPPPARQRRIRMCHCPHCGAKTKVMPKWPGEPCYLQNCTECFHIFDGSVGESWLEDRS